MRKLSSYTPSLIVLGTAIVVLVAGPSAVWQLTYAQTKARIIQASEALDNNPILEQLNQAYRDIATMVEPSVVHISTERTLHTRFEDDRIIASSGSGWVYDEQGHIVTNYHVIEGAERIEVQLNTGERREGQVVGYDQFTDIALIRIPPGRLFPAVRAAGDDRGDGTVRQGDMVFAFGSPFDFRFSMSSGVVSGVGRYVGVIRDDRGQPVGYENFIQVDAAINPGNSGGPLTDARGHVIGMNTAIATAGRANRVEEGQFGGIGLAIPIEMIEPVVLQLIGTGFVQKGYLGVRVVDRYQSIKTDMEVRGFGGYGLTVGRIEPGNPAVQAGLRFGDVITEINDQPAATVAQLESLTDGIGPDDTVELSVWRLDADSGEGRELRVTMPGVVVATGFSGVWLLQVDDEVAAWLSLLGFADRGVRVSRIDPEGPAADAGLLSGDAITHVNDMPVGSVAQLRSMISSMMPGQTVKLDLWRYEPQLDQGRKLTLEVPLARLDLVQISGIVPSEEGIRRLGIGRMDTCTPDLAEIYRVRFTPGVLIHEVITGSELDGIAVPGSIITSVMDVAVADVEEFYDQLGNYDLRSQRGARVGFVNPDGSQHQVVLHVQ